MSRTPKICPHCGFKHWIVYGTNRYDLRDGKYCARCLRDVNIQRASDTETVMVNGRYVTQKKSLTQSEAQQ